MSESEDYTSDDDMPDLEGAANAAPVSVDPREQAESFKAQGKK